MFVLENVLPSKRKNGHVPIVILYPSLMLREVALEDSKERASHSSSTYPVLEKTFELR